MEMKLFILLWLTMPLKSKLNKFTTTTTTTANTNTKSELSEPKQLVQIDKSSKSHPGNPRNIFPTKLKEISEKKIQKFKNNINLF